MSDLRLATRGSPLALAQAERVAGALRGAHPGLEVEVVQIETTGDQRTDEPLRTLGGQGIFVKEIQRALLDGAADLAVHSAKDLPALTPEELVLCAIPERLDPADVLVGRSLAGLGPGATIATGSPRRQHLLSELRPDLNFVELRGNMAARLAKPGTDGIDAVVAAAGGRHELAESLVAFGWKVEPIVAYETVARPPTLSEVEALGACDVVCFASPSAVTAFEALRDSTGAPLHRHPAAVIGATTAGAARQAGFVVVVATEATDAALAEAAAAALRLTHEP